VTQQCRVTQLIRQTVPRGGSSTNEQTCMTLISRQSSQQLGHVDTCTDWYVMPSQMSSNEQSRRYQTCRSNYRAHNECALHSSTERVVISGRNTDGTQYIHCQDEAITQSFHLPQAQTIWCWTSEMTRWHLNSLHSLQHTAVSCSSSCVYADTQRRRRGLDGQEYNWGQDWESKERGDRIIGMGKKHGKEHRVSTSRRKWYPPAAANAYGRHTPWLAD